MLTSSAKWLRVRLRRLVDPDPTESAEYQAAIEWQKEAPPDVNADTDATFKAIHEYGQAEFDAMVSAREKSTDQAESLFRFNTVLVVGVFAYFKAMPVATVPWAARIAATFWVLAMIVVTLVIRRKWRPTRQDLLEMQKFAAKDGKRLHAWMNVYTHAAIIQYRIAISNEGAIFNCSLYLTIAGLFFLLAAILAG